MATNFCSHLSSAHLSLPTDSRAPDLATSAMPPSSSISLDFITELAVSPLSLHESMDDSDISHRPPGDKGISRSRSIPSQILAVKELSKLSIEQIMHIAETYRRNHGHPITTSLLLEECDEYEKGDRKFPQKFLLSGEITLDTVGNGARGYQDNNNDIGGATCDSASFRRAARSSESYSDTVDGPTMSCFYAGQSKHKNLAAVPGSRFQSVDVNVDNAETRTLLERQGHPQPSLLVTDGHDRTDGIQKCTRGERPGASLSYSQGEQGLIDEQRELKYLQQLHHVLRTESDILKRSLTCTVCKMKPRGVTFLPCGHFSVCYDCSEPINKCHHCEQEILATVHTYMS